MYKKKVRLKYLGKDIEGSHSGEFFREQWLTVDVEGKSTKRYHNTIGILVQLSKCARILLDFLVEEMDDKNLVSNNNLFKKEFNQIIKVTGQKPYTSVTINKAFSELTDKNILNPIYKKKGTYQVDPVFYFKGTEKNREKLIRKNLERPNIKEINKIRREHFKTNDIQNQEED